MRHRKLLGEQQAISSELVPCRPEQQWTQNGMKGKSGTLHNRTRAQLPHNEVTIQNSGQTKSGCFEIDDFLLIA